MNEKLVSGYTAYATADEYGSASMDLGYDSITIYPSLWVSVGPASLSGSC